MKKRSIVNAYEPVRPYEEARNRMLQNILLSSEISLTGKDERIMRKKMKPLILAAIISLMVLLMGCAIVAMHLQDLKIGVRSSAKGQILDSQGNIIKETNLVQDVISLQGINGSPSFMGAKEWFAFEETYDPDLKLVDEEFIAPDAYDAYFIYNQEMKDKVDEIAEKYGLKLAGKVTEVQAYQIDVFFDALGFDNLHHEEAIAAAEYLSGYFYACGSFNIEFFVTLGEECQWEHVILLNMRYNKKDYLDTICPTLSNIETVEQWTYTTADGTDILIVMENDFAWFLCDQKDAFVSCRFQTNFELDSGEFVFMSEQEIEALADALDFSVKPKMPDVEKAQKALDELAAAKKAEQEAYEATRPDDTYAGFIIDRLEKMEHPENLYYYLADVDGDGKDEMLLGYPDICETVWTIKDGNLGFPQLTDQDWLDIAAMWLEWDIKPITEFPLN